MWTIELDGWFLQKTGTIELYKHFLKYLKPEEYIKYEMYIYDVCNWKKGKCSVRITIQSRDFGQNIKHRSSWMCIRKLYIRKYKNCGLKK